MTQTGSPIPDPSRSAWATYLWAVIAAFGTYFCMYMYRKPFTSASFEVDGWTDWDQKAVLVAAQVLGYLVSKIIGIRVVAEVRREHRALLLVGLIGLAHAALFLFAIAPSPWHIACIFLNGLPLGIVFGLVLGFLEGRRVSEALTAGLCASFILAGGVSKTVGTRILDQAKTTWGWSLHDAERWMPFLAGVVFLPLVFFFAWMLNRIPPPNARDEDARSRRDAMQKEERSRAVRKYAGFLVAISAMYLMVTILRSLRDDFAPEILSGLGASVRADAYASIDFYVALVAMLANGASIFIASNRTALLASMGVCAAGFLLTLMTVSMYSTLQLAPETIMVLIGAGLYLPYVAVHTTLFERMIALTRDRSNVGFFMYLADSIGYCGYVVLMLARSFLVPPTGIEQSFLQGFMQLCILVSLVGIAVVCWATFQFNRMAPAGGDAPCNESNGGKDVLAEENVDAMIARR